MADETTVERKMKAIGKDGRQEGQTTFQLTKVCALCCSFGVCFLFVFSQLLCKNGSAHVLNVCKYHQPPRSLVVCSRPARYEWMRARAKQTRRTSLQAASSRGGVSCSRAARLIGPRAGTSVELHPKRALGHLLRGGCVREAKPHREPEEGIVTAVSSSGLSPRA